MLRVDSDLANVADVVKVARLDVLKTSRIASAASALTKERLTDHACLCAIHSNLEAQRRLQVKGRSSSGSRANANIRSELSVGIANSIRLTSRGTDIVRERFDKDIGIALVVRTREVPLWWALFCSAIFLVWSWWRVHK